MEAGGGREIPFPIDRCINCNSHFQGESIPVSNMVISVHPTPSSSEGCWWLRRKEKRVRETELNVSILDALFSIFSGSDLMDLKNKIHEEEDPQLSMCLSCAEILATLYQTFIALLSVSNSSAYISQLIPKIQEWHCKAFTGSRDVEQNQLENPIGLMLDAVQGYDCGELKSSRRLQASKRFRFYETEPNEAGILNAKSHELMESTDQGHWTEDEEHVPSRRSERISNQKYNQQTSEANDTDETSESEFSEEESSESGSESAGSEFEMPKYFQKKKERQEKQEKPIQVKRSEPPIRFQCSVDGCEEKFLFHWLMNNHVQQYHEKKEPLRCKNCGFYGFDPDVFKSHCCREKGSKGDPERPFYCGFCNYASRSRASSIGHSRKHDAAIAPAAQCAVCGKVYSSRATLRTHLETHIEERNYLCNVCGMSFRQKRALREHNIVHDDNKPQECVICHKKFKRKHNLMQHYKHTNVHPRSIIEKILKGETLTEVELKEAKATTTTTTSTAVAKRKRKVGAKRESSFSRVSSSDDPFGGYPDAEETEVSMMTSKEDHVENSHTDEYQYDPIYAASLATSTFY